jgi:hypothetical protein
LALLPQDVDFGPTKRQAACRHHFFNFAGDEIFVNAGSKLKMLSGSKRNQNKKLYGGPSASATWGAFAFAAT